MSALDWPEVVMFSVFCSVFWLGIVGMIWAAAWAYRKERDDDDA